MYFKFVLSRGILWPTRTRQLSGNSAPKKIKNPCTCEACGAGKKIQPYCFTDNSHTI